MEDNKNYRESHGTGVLSTFIFMIAAVAVMIVLKHFIG